MGGRRNRSRTIITRVILLLLLGAIVNVAVAWACALLIDPTRTENPSLGLIVEEGHTWEVARVDRAATTLVMTTRTRGGSHPTTTRELTGGSTGISDDPAALLPKWGGLSRTTIEFETYEQPFPTDVIYEYRTLNGCGWPARTLWCDIAQRVGSMKDLSFTGLRGGLETPLPAFNVIAPRVLPLRPLWPGFAINTLFYAAVLWLLLAAPLALRRRSRIKRGLCPKCAYDLRGSGGRSGGPPRRLVPSAARSSSREGRRRRMLP